MTPSSNYLLTDVKTLDGRTVDILIDDGIIDRIEPSGTLHDSPSLSDYPQTNGDGRLVTPTFSETHLHLDATLTAGTPRWNEEGTLAEGINIWAEYKQSLTVKDVLERAEQTIQWLAANGVTRVRTHADTTEDELVTVKGLLKLKENVDDLVDLQVVAFPQDGIFSQSHHQELYEKSIELGVDILGGAPHLEHTREDGVQSVQYVVDLAEQRGLPIDMHIDETDDPQSRFIEVLASEALKRDMGKRVTASHVTAMHSYNNAYADKLIDLIARSGIGISTQPLANAVTQGRYDDYPRRRGHPRITELLEAGVSVAIAQDTIMDPWYHYGQGDPLDAVHMLLHYGHMSGWSDLDRLWTMITEHNADVWGADRYGLEQGCEGSLVMFEESNAHDALRRRQPRRLVLREGRVLARSQPASTRVHRPHNDISVTFQPE